MEKNVGKCCKTCGQFFDPSIAFCPNDGTRLSAEAIATSHELIQVTGRHLTNKKAESQSGPIVIDKVDVKTQNDDIEKTRKVTTSFEQTIGAKSRDGNGVNRANGASLGASTSAGLGAGNGGDDDDDDDKPHAFPADNPNLKPTLLGQTLDNQYEIHSVVGRGGMSFVYRAQHLLLRKTVAIKTLLPHLTVHATSLQRFQQEAQAASTLKHPNIIAIHTFGTTPDGEPYLVMDYVEGKSISDELDKYGFVSVDRAVDIFIQVADALSHAHQHGIIHRDLKPSNILLLEKEGKHDFVNIVDFGIAKMLPQDGQEGINLTQTGEVFGSPLYMSPEQCRGEKLDSRADIYSMGCLMYETLTGRAAMPGDNTMEVLYNHLHEIPAPMKAPLTYIPPELERMVFKTLAKDPAQRYQSMDALKNDLISFREHQKTNLFSRISNSWQLFWLRRKPRTKRDKIIVAIAISGFLCAGFFASQLAALYLAGADSPASKLPIVWDEDRDAQKPLNTPVEDSKARFDVMYHNRVAQNMEARDEPSADIINSLSGPAEYLAKRKLWKPALELFDGAYKYSVKYNDYLSLRTMHLRLNMAECYFQMRQFEESAHVLAELLGKLQEGRSEKDYVDISILSAKIGAVYYLEEKYPESIQALTRAYKIWTRKQTYTLPFTFYTLPTDLDTNYDYSLLVSRMATAYQRLYEKSVAAGQPQEQLLKDSVTFYKLASKQWTNLTGVHEGNHNGLVAMANYLLLQHALDKSFDLDNEYKALVEQADQFGSESAYYAIILRNYSDYLMDKGRVFDALSNRVHAWKIFGQLGKKGVVDVQDKNQKTEN